MIRFGIVMFQLVGIVLVKLFFSGDVSVNMDVAGQIDAGNELIVSVTLNKGDINGFSRFQMELPAGITATNASSANADFSFKDQKVRLIWLRLPSDPTVTFSFKIHCNERLKGTFNLAGKFSFIDNNERKSIDLQPKAIAIVPSASIDPNLIVDIRDFGRAAFPLAEITNFVACIRQKPSFSSDKYYIVNLLVNKESLKKFAKIEEVIPKGFTAMAIESKDGIFTFKDNKAKFLWMILPADPYFTVSYKLIPSTGVASPAITGTFSYILDDKTQSMMIIEKDVDLANLTPEIVKSILQSSPLIAVNQNINTTPVNTQQTIAVKQTPVKQPEVAQVVTKTPTVEETIVKQSTKTKPVQLIKPVNGGGIDDMLEPQSGIYYRVQLAAGHKPVNSKRYFRKYKLDDNVRKEQHQGWIKYSVGSFNVYKDARDYRVHIWNTTSIGDAFVSAYNDGKRITVQEALMVGSQKWYQ